VRSLPQLGQKALPSGTCFPQFGQIIASWFERHALFKGETARRVERFLRLPRLSRPPRVYVDAKILNTHDPALSKEAYVGYIVEGSSHQDVKQVQAAESDDAEILAILFAVEGLKDSLGRFTIVCDHESVVSEATRKEPGKQSELMKRLRKVLDENASIGLEALKANPAHGVVTAYVNALKSGIV